MSDWDLDLRWCPVCKGARVHGMGNPPCPRCGGHSRQKVIKRTPRDYSKPVVWTEEMAADLEAFHGKAGK